jgi:hypothetical protein
MYCCGFICHLGFLFFSEEKKNLGHYMKKLAE